MLNYIESVLKKKPELLVIQTETNDLTDDVKTMNEVRKLDKCVGELDKDQGVNIGFSSVINRSDRPLGHQCDKWSKSEVKMLL